MRVQVIVIISSPSLPETLVLASDDEIESVRAKLRARGNPGRAWSLSEVADLKARGVEREEAIKLAEAKMLMYAEKMWITADKKAKPQEQQTLTL